jgi:hypothetical protein
VHVPAFLKRQVFVNVAEGAKTEPSGIEISLTNCAWSQTGVGEEARVEVGRARVGKLTDVFVAAGGGRVGVLNGVTCVTGEVVDIACTVSAAAVKTALGSSVAGALDGRLQADNMKSMMNRIETGRAIFNILFSSIDGTILHPARHIKRLKKRAGYTNTDGLIFPFVPKKMAVISLAKVSQKQRIQSQTILRKACT